MLRWCLGLFVVMAGGTSSEACPIGIVSAPTFRQEAKQAEARIIVHGTIGNPHRVDGDGQTDFFIQTRLRDDPLMKGKRSLVIQEYLPVEKKNDPPQYILFCDVTKAKEVVPYRGVLVQGTASVEYVKKAIALDSSDPVRNLVFFFGHLDDGDSEVAEDAFKEFTLAEDIDIGAAGRKLDAAKIRRWLEDPNTPEGSTGLYAKLLAAAGTAKDGEILLAMLEDRSRELGFFDLEAILFSYIMLSPKKGWEYTLKILGNSNEEFSRRHAALKAVQYHAASRSGVVSNRQISAVYRLLLGADGLADIAIDELRLSKRWDLADTVIAVVKTDIYKENVVKWSLLRYALQCKGNAAATAHVAAWRKADPPLVAKAQKVFDDEVEYAKYLAGTSTK